MHSRVRVDVLCVEVSLDGHVVIGVGRVIVRRRHADRTNWWRGSTRRWSPYSRWAECTGCLRTSGAGRRRQAMQEIERENRGEERHSHEYDHVDGGERLNT